jgi:hypothetical protein
MKQKAEKFLNTALGGNMNISTLTPLALVEIMTAFAEKELAAINYTRCCEELSEKEPKLIYNGRDRFGKEIWLNKERL